MDKLVRHSYSRDERQKILEKTGCKCGHCGIGLETATMTVEHIFPVSKGGNDDEFNLVALCKACNYNKGSWVYKVDEYYKHILPEYKKQYREYNDKVASEYKQNRLINFDAVTYSIIPDKYKIMIFNMKKRGAKRKQIEQTANRLTMKVVMDRAYEGDAEEILSLINKLNKKSDNIFNTSMYDNVYSLRNDIKYGEAYVLRLNGNICGAFVFKKIKPDDINLVQLDIIEDNTRLRKKYIMALACFSDIASDIVPNIMEDMYQTMLRNDAIPMYFNILSNLYKVKDDVIMMPYTLDKVDGTLEFIHLKAIKSKFACVLSEVLTEFEEGELYSEDELSDIAEYMLENKSDEKEKNTYIEELLAKSKTFSEQLNLGDKDNG